MNELAAKATLRGKEGQQAGYEERAPQRQRLRGEQHRHFPAQPEGGIFATADIIRSPTHGPEAYTLRLAGCGALGWIARRRKQAEKPLSQAAEIPID